MRKELKVDRHWLLHGTPVFTFPILSFFGHKRTHALELFVWGWRKRVLCLSVTIVLMWRCMYLFCLMHTSKQSLKLLRLYLRGCFTPIQVYAATGWGRLALAFTPQHISTFLLPTQGFCARRNQVAKQWSRSGNQFICKQLFFFFLLGLFSDDQPGTACNCSGISTTSISVGRSGECGGLSSIITCLSVRSCLSCLAVKRNLGTYLKLILCLRCSVELFSSFKFYHK